MSWHFSRALVAEYLAANCSVGEPYAPLRSTHTAEEFCNNDKMTGIYPRSPSGTTCVVSTDDPGENLLVWFLADSRAKTCQAQTAEPSVLTGQKAPYGGRCIASLAKSNQNLWSSKIHRILGRGDLIASSKAWPTWGIYVRGVCFELTALDLPTRAADCGWSVNAPRALSEFHTKLKLGNLPTPLASLQNKNYGVWSLDSLTGGIWPEFREWLMGWPIGWTAVEPLETARWDHWFRWFGLA